LEVGFIYRVEVSQYPDHTAANVGAGGVANFPVLLTEANLPAAVFSQSDNGGGDLRFSSDINGTARLACEVVSFDTVAKTARYGNVPTLSDTTRLASICGAET